MMFAKYRINGLVMVLFLMCSLSAFADSGIPFSDLCPAADRIEQLNLNKEPLYLPDSEDQIKDLLGRIFSSNQDEANRAIIALALAGNLQAFNELLNAQNVQ